MKYEITHSSMSCLEEEKGEDSPLDACKSTEDLLFSPHFLKHCNINVLRGNSGVKCYEAVGVLLKELKTLRFTLRSKPIKLTMFVVMQSDVGITP